MAIAASLEALLHGSTVVASIVPDNVYAEIRSAKTLCAKTRPREARLLRF